MQISTRGQEEVIQVGIQGRETSFEDLPPMNLAFVIDKSESMIDQDKIDWVKDAFDIFSERVRDKDFVSLEVFDDTEQKYLQNSSEKGQNPAISGCRSSSIIETTLIYM